jgi:TolA-binding protein
MTKQVQVIPVAIVAVVSFVASWLGNYLLSSPQQSQIAIASINKDVEVLKHDQITQADEIKSLTLKLDRMDKNIVKLLVANNLQP